MACAFNRPAQRKRGWVRRLRAAAAAATILAATPGAVATVAPLIRSLWLGSPPVQPIESNIPRDLVHPGPGKCPTFHFWKARKCRDSRGYQNRE